MILDVSGALDTCALVLDATAGGQSATGGLASARIDGGLRVRGDATMRTDATTVNGDGGGGRARLDATNGSVLVDGDLLFDAGAHSFGGGARAGERG